VLEGHFGACLVMPKAGSGVEAKMAILQLAGSGEDRRRRVERWFGALGT